MAEVAVRNGTRQAAKLGTLAERINEEHRACGLALNSALDHAIEAGRLLAEAKASLPHGEFGPWVATNFEGSDRTARAYLRLYRNRDQEEGKTAKRYQFRYRGCPKGISWPEGNAPLA